MEVLSHGDAGDYGPLLAPIRRVGLNHTHQVSSWRLKVSEAGRPAPSYPDDLRSKVALADHQVPGLIQLDDGPGVGLDLRFEGLVLLQLALWDTRARREEGAGPSSSRSRLETPTCRLDGSL